jgi:aspartyl protease family protein
MANPFKRTGAGMLVVAWLLVFAGLYWFFSDWQAGRVNPNTAARLQVAGDEIRLQRNREGHYLAEGEINGMPVVFLLDTGATHVAMSESLAARLGLARGAAVRVTTANGEAMGFYTRLQRVRLGPIELQQVSALVTPGMTDDAVLLGMSFLKRLEFSQRGDELTLSPPTPDRK